MLKKLTALMLAFTMTAAFAGCDQAGDVADKAKDGVDTAAEATKDAAADVVPDSAKDTVDGAVDQGGDMAKEGIDKAVGAGE